MRFINLTIGNDVRRRSLPGGDSGRAFVVAKAEKGPLDAPVEVHSLSQAVTTLGQRITDSPLYDVLDIAFRRGLDTAYIVRAAGSAAAAAKHVLVGGEVNVLEATASTPGDWGNSVKVEVEEGTTSGTFRIKVKVGEAVQETSPELADNDAAVAWAATYSRLIQLTKLAAGDPDEQTVTLSGGSSDHEHVESKVITACLEKFGPDMGYGQVYAPGYTDEATQTAVLAHCEATRRTPILDGVDTAEVDEIIEQVGALRSLAGHKYAGVFVPWDVAPGLALGTTRTVPPGARQLGAIASADRASGTANVPAAADEGKDSYLVGLSQSYSDADIERLTEAGVNASVIEDGEVTTLGWRTLADPVTERPWLSLASARQMLLLAASVWKVLRRYRAKPLDAQGVTRTACEGACQTEVIQPAYRARAIYGDTEGEAGQVVVEQDVDPTDGSIAKLTGQLSARPTKYSEVIDFEVVASDIAL